MPVSMRSLPGKHVATRAPLCVSDEITSYDLGRRVVKDAQTRFVVEILTTGEMIVKLETTVYGLGA
jgi:hypothetical protein